MLAAMTTKGVVAVQHRKYVDCRKGLVVPEATQENLKTAFQIVAVDLLLLSAQGRTTPVIQPSCKDECGAWAGLPLLSAFLACLIGRL
jgi:hypothetical protein